jgi:hypothetical protein
MMEHCAYCPIGNGVECRGLAVRRYCELIDPAHPAFNPRYREIIVQQSINPPDRYPSLAAQTGSFLGILKAFAKSGFQFADRAERTRRRSICEQCPQFNAEDQRCMVCGCSMRTKPWLLVAQCPIGKWM